MCGRRPEAAAELPAAMEVRMQVIAATFLVTWMVFSSFFVVLMKLTLNQFPYPLALTALHMASCWICFGCVRLCPFASIRERLMPDWGKDISWSDYFFAIVPIAILNCAGLALGNYAVKCAAVAFLQMIKPANLIWGSLVAFAFKVEIATLTHIIIVIIVVSGVALASMRNADFSTIGLVLQLLATFSEGTKLVMIQNMTGKRLKLDPLTAIFKYSPIACVCLLALSHCLEGGAPWAQLRADPTLVGTNAAAAVLLNVLIVGTVARTSAVVFILGGVVKDIGTIAVSVVIFASAVGLNQVVGFGLSVLGILMYKVYKQHTEVFAEHGFLEGFRRVLLSDPRVAMPSGKDVEERQALAPSAGVEANACAADAAERGTAPVEPPLSGR